MGLDTQDWYWEVKLKRIVLFIIALVLWLLLTHTLNWQSVSAGILAAFIAALIFGNIFAKEAKKYFNPIRWFWFICYIPLFIWACIKANLDVAYRVLSPWMPIKPGIVKIKTNLNSAKSVIKQAVKVLLGPLPSRNSECEYCSLVELHEKIE